MTILITGAGSGIGYAASLALAQRGHTVIATAKTMDALEKLRNEADTLGLTLKYAQLDTLQPDDWQRAAEWPIDVVINNAGIGEGGPLVEIPLERVRTVWETNVLGVLGVIQVVAKRLIAQKHGRIIIVGSTAGLVSLPFLGAYTMSKFALEAAVDALRMELRDFNIHVSLIEPGKIDTGFNQRMTKKKYEWLNNDSAYAEKIEHMKLADAKFFSREYPVNVVVKGIIHAVESKRPRTRYITPRRIGISIHIARLLPDRVRDWIIHKMM